MASDSQTLDDVLAALARVEAHLDSRETPVRGLREAADALRVSRSTVAGVIEGLPPARRPVAVGDRGTVWWRSRAALFDWWEDAHGAARLATPPSQVAELKKKKKSPTRASSPRSSGSLADRLRAISEGR